MNLCFSIHFAILMVLSFFTLADNILVFYSPLLPTKVIEKKLIHKFSQRLI